MDDEQSKILEKLRAISAQFKAPESPEDSAMRTREMLNYQPKDPFAQRGTEMSAEETADIKARAAAIRAAREGKVYNPDLARLSGALQKKVSPEDQIIEEDLQRIPASQPEVDSQIDVNEQRKFANIRKYLKRN